MVLNLMRRHATGWIIKIIIGLIAVVFIFYFGYSFREGGNPKVATVNGSPISQKEYSAVYNQLLEYYRKQFGDSWNESVVKSLDIKGKALDILIKKELIRQNANKLGIEVIDVEVQKSIANYPLFQTDGKFDPAKYNRFLQATRMTPQDFENEVSNQIIEQKLYSFFSTFFMTTQNERKEFLNYFYEQALFRFIVFEPSKYMANITLSEDELKSFFENNKDKYIIPEKMKFSYVIFDPAKFKKDITIEEEQMKDYYEANQEKFKEPEKVKARHILLKIDQPKKEAEIKKKAMEIYKKAKEGADFAKLASQHSQDPKTKEKGGDLGYFPRGVMVKEFEDVAFGLKPGEISEPIKTQFGFHIIKVEDKKEEGIKDFDSAKPEITKILTEQAAFEKAYEEAMRFVDGISPNMDLGQYAASKGLKLITTNLISRKDKFPIQGLQEKQIDHLFSLGENEVSDVLTVQNRYYVFKAIEKVASHNAEFEEVKDQVNQDLKTQKAKELATSDAKKALQLLKEGKSLDEVAKQFKLEIKSSDFVRRNQPVEFIGYVPALMEEVFKLSKEKPVPEDIVDSEKGPVVFVLQDKKQAELENVQQEKQRVEAIFLKQQQDWLFANWLENERKKAKVEIHKDLL